MKNYWISWWHVQGEFTLNSPWWMSGMNAIGTKSSFCAAVKAEQPVEAFAMIMEAYGNSIKPPRIEFRFCEEMPTDWSPFCDRFPKADWMQW